MIDLIKKYRVVLEQGFVPICVGDRFHIEVLADAVSKAGARVIEVTCRRPGVLREIMAVKKSFPELLVMAGSVVDDGPFLQHLQRRLPDMPSIRQLMEVGADGIVSALPLRCEMITAISPDCLVIPGVETATEAVQAIESGAHFAKLFTADLMGGDRRVQRLTCAATHRLLPLFITGGITLEKIVGYLGAGAALLGSGWDIILGQRYQDLQDRPNVGQLSAALKTFLQQFAESRTSISPGWKEGQLLDDAAFLMRQEHYVPAQWLKGEKQ